MFKTACDRLIPDKKECGQRFWYGLGSFWPVIASLGYSLDRLPRGVRRMVVPTMAFVTERVADADVRTGCYSCHSQLQKRMAWVVAFFLLLASCFCVLNAYLKLQPRRPRSALPKHRLASLHAARFLSCEWPQREVRPLFPPTHGQYCFRAFLSIGATTLPSC